MRRVRRSPTHDERRYVKALPTPSVGSRRARRAVATLCVAGALGLVAATAAEAQIGTPATPANSIVVVATGQAEVKPANRQSNASIRAAVHDALRLAAPRALVNARVSADNIAAASNLKLGVITAVEDQSVYFNGFNYQFGPNQFCGKAPRRKVVRVNGRRKVIRLPAKRRCNVPEYAIANLKVTFAATPAPAPAPAR
jgi:hypothetical protein